MSKRSGKERKREEKRIIRRALADLSGRPLIKKKPKKQKFKAEWWAGPDYMAAIGGG